MARRSAVGGSRQPPTGAQPDDADRGSGENPDPEPDPEAVAHTICMRLLTVRARSRVELSDALAARAVPAEAAQRVLDRLARVGLIDDEAFATEFVRAKRAERGLASRELSRQLRAKGVATDTVQAVLAELDEDGQRETARRLVQRRLRSLSSLPVEVQTRRLAGMLARKGYSPAVSYEVVRAAVAGADDAGLDSDALFG
jgi:regulatory protein